MRLHYSTRFHLHSIGQSDAKPLLHLLYWLPVRHRITYKMAVLTHKVLATSAPAYPSNVTSIALPVGHLRSSHAPLLTMPRTKTNVGRRAFLWLHRVFATHYLTLSVSVILLTHLNDILKRIYLTCPSLAPSSASVPSNFMVL